MLGAIAAFAMIWAIRGGIALAADDGPGCADGNVCWWNQTDYNGDKGVRDCHTDIYGLFDVAKNSAKNRCGADRFMRLYWAGPGPFDLTLKACLDSGESRPDPGRFNQVIVGGAGSHCNN